MSTPVVLSIAGSDSGSGAGIQADLKTCAALNTYCCTAITAITAQNTKGVDQVTFVTPQMVIRQCESVMSDIPVNAIKTGMLGNKETVLALCQYLESLPKRPPLVVDPVMLSTSGHRLLPVSAIELLKSRLFPMATIITPNLPEAALILNKPVPESVDEMKLLLEGLIEFGNHAVLLKGGHLPGEKSIDLFHNGSEIMKIESDRIATTNTHGTGCSLASAIAAFQAKGEILRESVNKAKQYVYKTILNSDALDIGHGSGPVHHFTSLWRTQGTR